MVTIILQTGQDFPGITNSKHCPRLLFKQNELSHNEKYYDIIHYYMLIIILKYNRISIS